MLSGFRRVYVYLIIAVSLAVVAVGAANLLEIGILHAWNAVTGTWLFDSPPSDVRQRLSLFLAMTTVALPILIVHVYLTERFCRQDAGEERQSAVRAIYFMATLTVSQIVAASSLAAMLDTGFARLIDPAVSIRGQEGVLVSLTLLISASVWVAHVWRRYTDERLVELPRRALWPLRIYLYAALLVTAILFLSGVTELLISLVEEIVETGVSAFGFAWVDASLSTPLAWMVVGGIVWTLHWTYSLRLLQESGWRGDSERSSQLRRIYLFVLLVAGIAMTLGSAIAALGSLFEWIFADGLLRNSDVIDPLTLAAVFSLVWIFHRHRFRIEFSETHGAEGLTSATRLHQYTVAFIGLVLGAIGLGYLAGVTIEFMFRGIGLSDAESFWATSEASVFAALVIVGGLFWLAHILPVQRAVTTNPDRERASSARRAYLYLVLTFSTLALLAALGTLIYQLLQAIMGISTTPGLGSDIAVLLGVAFIAAATLAAHVRWLLSDIREISALVPDVPESVERASLMLRLTGPDEETVQKALEQIRSGLPQGVEIVDAAGSEYPVRPGEGDDLELQTGEDESDDDHQPDPDQESLRIFR